MTRCFAAVLCSNLVIGLGGSRPAGFIVSLTVSTTPEPGGVTRYEYTLTNGASSSLPAVELQINVSADADLQSIVGPSGWDVTYGLGSTFIDWTSSSEATDLQPGDIAVFAFTSPLVPTSQQYLILGLDTSTLTSDTSVGQIAGPGTSPSRSPPP